MHTDVIVIGGGISGLSTALHCISHGYRCVILERNASFGGRIHTIFGKAWKYEAGAGRIHKNHHRTLSLLNQFGMTLLENASKKEYRDIHHLRKHHKNPSSALLQRVIDATPQMSKHALQQMTFGTLCQNVLGQTHAQLLVDSFGSVSYTHLTLPTKA